VPFKGGPRVLMVSGQMLEVMSDAEAKWWNTSRDKYSEQTRFSENTDLQDLDRLLILELMVYRWSQFLAMGHDYEGFTIEEEKLRRAMREYSDQISKLKASMGLTKQVRDAAAAEGDFSQWMSDLKVRAKAFGIHREHQLTKALVLMNELSGMVGTFDRADAEERAKTGYTTEKDIVAWVRHTMLPEYHALDEHFRKNQQVYWVRDQ
jgi:hypothetical protein